MEFLGVGYQELLLILVLLLVVVGPERLPAMAYQIGRAVRTLQQYARAVRNEFSDEFDYLEEQYRTVRGEVDTARTELQKQQSQWQRDLQEASAVDLPPLLESPESKPAEASTNGAHAGATPATEAPADPAPAAAKPAQQEQDADEQPPAPPMVF
ncbi:MAG: Sec-independent protein translocase protein TatB [Dehalococcoidia bacterium]|nr:Sec-independent protein translocase protein TatB [Dehalococcoidia bacterium]